MKVIGQTLGVLQNHFTDYGGSETFAHAMLSRPSILLFELAAVRCVGNAKNLSFFGVARETPKQRSNDIAFEEAQTAKLLGLPLQSFSARGDTKRAQWL